MLYKVGLSKRSAILVAIFAFGIVSGAHAWAWPFNSAAYPNIYAMLLGDELYINATKYLANPGSSNPHMDIPWFLRVRQVYLTASIILSLIIAFFVELWIRVRKKRK